MNECFVCLIIIIIIIHTNLCVLSQTERHTQRDTHREREIHGNMAQFNYNYRPEMIQLLSQQKYLQIVQNSELLESELRYYFNHKENI